MTIRGVVCCGSGRANSLHTPERVAARENAAGMGLAPGTLNVRVHNASAALRSLGSPRTIREPWCRIGPGLALYPVFLEVAGKMPTTPAVVTRSENSRAARILEVMAGSVLRQAHGINDGDVIRIWRRPW